MILEDRFNTFCTFHKPEDKIKILFSYVRKTSIESSVEYTRENGNKEDECEETGKQMVKWSR